MNLALKAVLLATVAGALTTTAFAAGTTKAGPKPTMPGVVVDSSHNWDGMFFGGFIGYGVGLADETTPGIKGPYPPAGVDINLAGGVVGLSAGKNFAVGNGVVLGIVGDVGLSSLNGSYTSSTFPGSFYRGTTQSITSTADLRGRIGFDAGGFLPYLTGGLAVANSTRNSKLFGNPGPMAFTTQFGYVAGAGIEFALAGNSSVNVQYLYSDYGTGTYKWTTGNFDNPQVHLTSQTVTVGMNWGF